jgi:hypothetical protein
MAAGGDVGKTPTPPHASSIREILMRRRTHAIN